MHPCGPHPADGKQFMVDAETGLANIPDRYRTEVAQQLEILQKLASAALMSGAMGAR